MKTFRHVLKNQSTPRSKETDILFQLPIILLPVLTSAPQTAKAPCFGKWYGEPPSLTFSLLDYEFLNSVSDSNNFSRFAGRQ